MSISEFIQIFLSICGGVSIVGGAAAVIFKWITPAFRLNKRVETLEEHMDELTAELSDISKDAECREERDLVKRYVEKLRSML